MEIKAQCKNHNFIREILKSKNGVFKGVDFQTDTYFNCNFGRLKLRQGNIENNLIHYIRENKSGPKESIVTLYKASPDSALKILLNNALGVLVEVKKKREIYFIDNVKFHIDLVDGLGSFVEIEAIDSTGKISKEKLLSQCEYYLKIFQIKTKQLITQSYSDLLLQMIED
ncbi:adenylate cyclase [candidate division KSB1 bacterium 4572_119]|nr:MAG: adenylate cyclase [candidate division KSB1 bacterium 4572_119]